MDYADFMSNELIVCFTKYYLSSNISDWKKGIKERKILQLNCIITFSFLIKYRVKSNKKNIFSTFFFIIIKNNKQNGEVFF